MECYLGKSGLWKRRDLAYYPVEMVYIDLFVCPATMSLNGTLRIHEPNSTWGQIHSAYSDPIYLDNQSFIFRYNFEHNQMY